MAYSEHLFDDLYLHEIPEHVRHYIDYEAFSRDLFLYGYFSIQSFNYGVYVFHG